MNEPERRNEPQHRSTSSRASLRGPSYPLEAYLPLGMGGFALHNHQTNSNQDDYVDLNRLSPTQATALLQQAYEADSALHGQYYAPDSNDNLQQPHSLFLPSLSLVAQAVFGRFTGVKAEDGSSVMKDWANRMVLTGSLSGTEASSSLIEYLQHHNTGTKKQGPCGYVFGRGDIAWNCRTCQTDPTCVICDDCFQNSNHEGHEVYFHRTSPGGCCDCGDLEAWKPEGCCDQHRPPTALESDSMDTQNTTEEEAGEEIPMEAVRMAEKALEQAMETLEKTSLPPRVLSALGVVVGAAVQTLVDAVQGAGIAADAVQWKRQWAHEAAQIQNRAIHPHEYRNYTENYVNMEIFLRDNPPPFPYGYELTLRLHNDDVHTFDEVIDALHEPRRSHEDAGSPSLVDFRDRAMEKTHQVDAQGQVDVRTYKSISAAMQGFLRLKSRGLHASVVSSVQMDLEHRARQLSVWLTEVAAAHPAAAAIVVHALVQVTSGHDLQGVHVWPTARCIPAWASPDKVFDAFPPHLSSSYLSHEEAELLHGMCVAMNKEAFVNLTGADPDYYSRVPYRVTPDRYVKSPHALWGTLPSVYGDAVPDGSKHPLLKRIELNEFNPAVSSSIPNTLLESVFYVDTDLRKQQEADRITSSVYPHRLPGLYMVSGIGTLKSYDVRRPPTPSAMDLRHLLNTSSFKAPVSALLTLLLLDPYPTKQVRAVVHSLFLSLLTDQRFKCRFAGVLGVAYRPLSTLFCAGVGTEADTPLHFTVQIFTTGSLVRALGSSGAIERLLLSDQPGYRLPESSIGVFTVPIAHNIVRCIHTNLLGATKEVNMILNNTNSGNDSSSQDEIQNTNDPLTKALTYIAGEHPLMTILPGAPDDGFLDSRSTRHKRLPQLIRDLEYVVETPGTTMKLLRPEKYPIYSGPILSFRGEEVVAFPTVYARLLRLAQGMDPQKRKISGGHVEYEQNRWLEAFGLSLNFAGTRDALADSAGGGDSSSELPFAGTRIALGNLIAALLREMKLWLYREGMLETGLPALDLAQVEALQRSTLHVGDESSQGVAVSCATGIKMTEAQLSTIEKALRAESTARLTEAAHNNSVFVEPGMADWLRVPHNPLNGDSLSFHLPLHRTIAKCVRSLCSAVVPIDYRERNKDSWWKLPVLDDKIPNESSETIPSVSHPLVQLIKPTIRSSNCRVVWNAGPDCSPQEAQKRRSRSRAISANVAVAKIMHSVADHPARCVAACQQIERHLWARNGTSVSGMAINYSSAPLCRSFRDLDLLMIQLSASGMSFGLGPRRVFEMLMSRFSMMGYLVDPTLRSSSISGSKTWVQPPRLQDPDYAVALSESFFSTICVVVTELPPPPPTSFDDETHLKASIKRELVHALAAEPRSRSEALTAAHMAVVRREDADWRASNSTGVFRNAFAEVLEEIAVQRISTASRGSSAPSAFELKADFCEDYDPTFYHLRRHEHQHAMDVVARLRKQKLSSESGETQCIPLVAPLPRAHPRFLACRLILHLPALDAAIRRALLHAVTNGSWLPPPAPISDETQEPQGTDSPGTLSDSIGVDTPALTFNRRMLHRDPHSLIRNHNSVDQLFSIDTVKSSSVSFIEVIQLLTLQIHTLEECASLHRTVTGIDTESSILSQSLSINSYLRRLLYVPESLESCWAFKPFPDGPIPSKGSGENRPSILGFLITLYEHRSDFGASDPTSGASAQNDEGHGGARSLSADGLKWIIRFVNSLVDGAPSVSTASSCASSGRRFFSEKEPTASSTWSIDDDIVSAIKRMLADLPELWPTDKTEATAQDLSSAKKKERGKAAQLMMMERMRRKQLQFAESMGPTASQVEDESKSRESELCIICRCDDADGENNGPIGYLGHVQRSRNASLRMPLEVIEGHSSPKLSNMYRVVGHMGCQLRESEAMDSKAVTCLPKGSIVTVLNAKINDRYGILSRRVKVRHTSVDAETGEEIISTGWASVQSSQGYIILAPLLSLCYTNSRWGNTRPLVKQCGHAAHLDCVQKHTLSLHQRAAGDQPYDGRFAANIAEGEFLCPLCKQLCNILVPRGLLDFTADKLVGQAGRANRESLLPSISKLDTKLQEHNKKTMQAFRQFGSSLYSAMGVPWDTLSNTRMKLLDSWHPAIQKWDFEEDSVQHEGVGDLLRLLRQQHISWAAIGYSSAAMEASTRSRAEKTPFGVFPSTSDPWQGFNRKSRLEHPMLLELKRTLIGASGLLQCLLQDLHMKHESPSGETVLSSCLGTILRGENYALRDRCLDPVWSQLTALVASMPCHVSRDGTLSHRSEARCTTAAMWAVRGIGSDEGSEDNPPTPLAVRRMFKAAGEKALSRGWGTMNPTIEDHTKTVPYRPFIASSFLYVPLLGWDLNTLTGAMFSTFLANSAEDLPTSAEILYLSRSLILGRLIQAILSPSRNRHLDPDEIDVDFCWDPSEIDEEGKALSKLIGHVKSMISSRCKNIDAPLVHPGTDQNSSSLLASVGFEILPFCRSLVLLLRAFAAAIEERNGSSIPDSTQEARLLSELILDDEAMSQEDGFFFLHKLQGPKPSDIANGKDGWLNLINRWVVSFLVLEMHHGNVGPDYLKTELLGEDFVSASGKAFVSVLPKEGSKPRTSQTRKTAVAEDIIMQESDGLDRIGGFLDSSDDELTGDVDMEIDDEMMRQDGVARLSRHGQNNEGDEFLHSSDGSDSESETEVQNSSDRKYAGVSKNPIISYQPSFLGLSEVGPGRQGTSELESGAASAVMLDLSHLGMIHTPNTSIFSLIQLPKSFVELYNLVGKVKGKEDSVGHDVTDESSHSETAICLITGTVMKSGSSRRSGYSRGPTRAPGNCTLHARKYGSGTGVFFLLQKCTVLLMHNNKSAYSPSLYVDEHGEEDPGLRRGRPLFLNEDRYSALETLWRQHGIPREVAQIRSTSDRVIRDNWY